MLEKLTKRILILGGMGSLGQPVVRQLIADGINVRLLTREPFNTRLQLGGTIISNMDEAGVERWLADSNLVTREEFDAVREMAARAREENERLEARIAALEARLAKKSGG